MQPDSKEIERIIETSLKEDIGKGDVTSNLLIDVNVKTELSFVTREDIILCGLPIVNMVFDKVDAGIEKISSYKDGEKIITGTSLLKVRGSARSILAGERVALNLLQHMSGIATLTRRYIDEVKHTKAKILDTRKTLPGLRVIEKYAVEMGGGQNHRMRLDDGILIKDNHISICGGVSEALKRVKMHMKVPMKIEIECETKEEVEQALAGGADILLLDNMKPELLREIVKLVNGRVPLEASGKVNLQTVREIAESGVDYISIGAITHSAPNADIGLDIIS